MARTHASPGAVVAGLLEKCGTIKLADLVGHLIGTSGDRCIGHRVMAATLPPLPPMFPRTARRAVSSYFQFCDQYAPCRHMARFATIPDRFGALACVAIAQLSQLLGRDSFARLDPTGQFPEQPAGSIKVLKAHVRLSAFGSVSIVRRPSRCLTIPPGRRESRDRGTPPRVDIVDTDRALLPEVGSNTCRVHNPCRGYAHSGRSPAVPYRCSPFPPPPRTLRRDTSRHSTRISRLRS